MEDFEAPQDEVRNVKEPEMNIDTTRGYQVISDAQLLGEDAARCRRTVQSAEAEAKTDQDLCDEFSEQAIRSSSESDRFVLQPLLLRGTDKCNGIDMKMGTKTGQDLWKGPQNLERCRDGLPEVLVERIISRIPFPWLFKARILSRSWFFKFPVQSVRSSQPSFQSLISSVSSKWATYYPLFLTKRNTIAGFDRSSSQWRSMVRLSYLPAESYVQHSKCGSECNATTAGPLICLFHSCARDCTVFVSNVITKSWRKLPDLPRKRKVPEHVRLLMEVDSDSYKVLLVYRSGENSRQIHVYHSSLQKWTVTKFDPDHRYWSIETLSPYSVYLDKKLFFLYLHGSALQLCTYEVEHGAWLTTEIYDFRSVYIHSLVSVCILDFAILVCEDKLMVAAWYDDRSSVHNNTGIFQFDWSDTKQLKEVCTGPPNNIVLYPQLIKEHGPLDYEMEFGSDASFIYFRLTDLNGKYAEAAGDIDNADSRILSYNLETNKWELFLSEPLDWHSGKKWMRLAFEPGLHPFALV